MQRELVTKFVEFIPRQLDQGVLYISIEYATASHLCACGCGITVVTPLTPTDWILLFDGTVSLDPSIGNWSFECKSHYWVRNNQIRWAKRWSNDQIAVGRQQDRIRKEAFNRAPEVQATSDPPSKNLLTILWEQIRSLFKRQS